MVPTSVRAAAVLLLLYGALVAANAVVLRLAGGGVDDADYLRALVRLPGMALLAWGLLHRRVWAWWISVLLGGVWVVMAVFTAVVFATTDARDFLPLPTLSVIFIAASILLLGGVLSCLLGRSARAAFRDVPSRADQR